MKVMQEEQILTRGVTSSISLVACDQSILVFISAEKSFRERRATEELEGVPPLKKKTKNNNKTTTKQQQ